MKKILSRLVIISFLLLSSFQKINCRIYVNSIPKCGTHLLTKLIHLITKKKGINTNKIRRRTNKQIEGFDAYQYIDEKNEFFHKHLYFSNALEQKLITEKFKSFIIYRDPRDQIVSHAFWTIKRSKNKGLCNYQKNCPKTVSQLIDIFIKRINNFYGAFLPWLNSKAICSIKFENLIGPNGGGSQSLQNKELDKIFNYLSINKSSELKQFCINNLFGGTSTFRKGQIGTWKEHFTKEQINEFKKVAGHLLIELGYEKDLNW